jgi:hypothetical protein
VPGPRRAKQRRRLRGPRAPDPALAGRSWDDVPTVRLGRQQPNSVAPAVYAIVERGCMKRPELAAVVRCQAEMRLTDGYPAVRLTFADAGIFIEDAPPGDRSAEPPGEEATLEQVEALEAAPGDPEEPRRDPMLDTGVRMARFRPDILVEGSLTEIIAIMTTPTVRGVPKLTDARGWSALATIAAGRVRFRGNLRRARQLVRLLQI